MSPKNDDLQRKQTGTGFLARIPQAIQEDLDKGAVLHDGGFLLPEADRKTLLASAPSLLREERERRENARKKREESDREGIEQMEAEENQAVERGEEDISEVEESQRARREKWREQVETEVKRESEKGEPGCFLDEHFNLIVRGGELKEKSVYINAKAEVFVLGPRLGGGKSGEVYITQNCTTGKWACMKQLAPERPFEGVELDRLRQEGAFGFHESLSNTQVLNMYLVHGEDLLNFLEPKEAPNRQLSFEQALAMNISIVEAYESLQRNGYVHRDIKLENIIYDKKRQQCFAIDFGSVRTEGEKPKEPDGTPAYMTPEVVSMHPASFADDIYALGLVNAEVLSAALPGAIFSQEDWDNIPVELKKMDEEREAYIDSIATEWPKHGWRGRQMLAQGNPGLLMHQKIWSVALGAKDESYQHNEQLSKEQIKLCQLLYDMTGPPGNRKTLNAILTEMRSIRLEHIKKAKNDLENKPLMKNTTAHPPNDMDEQTKVDQLYNQTLKELFKKRDELDSKGKVKPEQLTEELKVSKEQLQAKTMPLVDELDILLLRAIDSNPVNRPMVEELVEYKSRVDETLKKKAAVTGELQHSLQKRQTRMQAEQGTVQYIPKPALQSQIVMTHAPGIIKTLEDSRQEMTNSKLELEMAHVQVPEQTPSQPKRVEPPSKDPVIMDKHPQPSLRELTKQSKPLPVQAQPIAPQQPPEAMTVQEKIRAYNALAAEQKKEKEQSAIKKPRPHS